MDKAEQITNQLSDIQQSLDRIEKLIKEELVPGVRDQGRVEIEEVSSKLGHMESLLQRLPEMIAVAIMLEKEKKDAAALQGRTYSDSVEICPVNRR